VTLLLSDQELCLRECPKNGKDVLKLMLKCGLLWYTVIKRKLADVDGKRSYFVASYFLFKSKLPKHPITCPRLESGSVAH